MCRFESGGGQHTRYSWRDAGVPLWHLAFMQSFGYDTREFLKVYHVSVACLGMCGYSSVVEHLVAIENVARSTRVTRFENCRLTPRFVPGGCVSSCAPPSDGALH